MAANTATTDAINAALSDNLIRDAIDSHDDSDHPDAFTVEEVRAALSFVETSARQHWTEWMEIVNDGDGDIVAQTDDIMVVSAGTRNPVKPELDAMESAGVVDLSGDDRAILYSILTRCMHELARAHSDRNWGVTYPWVLPADAEVEE